MAASPDWKVYSGTEYRAACKYVEDAAALVALLGDGATIRFGHARKAAVWTEGKEDQSAAESYDHVASVVEKRMAVGREERRAEWERLRGTLPDEHQIRSGPGHAPGHE